MIENIIPKQYNDKIKQVLQCFEQTNTNILGNKLDVIENLWNTAYPEYRAEEYISRSVNDDQTEFVFTTKYNIKPQSLTIEFVFDNITYYETDNRNGFLNNSNLKINSSSISGKEINIGFVSPPDYRSQIKIYYSHVTSEDNNIVISNIYDLFGFKLNDLSYLSDEYVRKVNYNYFSNLFYFNQNKVKKELIEKLFYIFGVKGTVYTLDTANWIDFVRSDSDWSFFGTSGSASDLTTDIDLFTDMGLFTDFSGRTPFIEIEFTLTNIFYDKNNYKRLWILELEQNIQLLLEQVRYILTRVFYTLRLDLYGEEKKDIDIGSRSVVDPNNFIKVTMMEEFVTDDLRTDMGYITDLDIVTDYDLRSFLLSQMNSLKFVYDDNTFEYIQMQDLDVSENHIDIVFQGFVIGNKYAKMAVLHNDNDDAIIYSNIYFHDTYNKITNEIIGHGEHYLLQSPIIKTTMLLKFSYNGVEYTETDMNGVFSNVNSLITSSSIDYELGKVVINFVHNTIYNIKIDYEYSSFFVATNEQMVINLQIQRADYIKPPDIIVSLDTTPPLAPTIIGLTNGSYNVNKTFTVGDIESGANVQYSLNNGSSWKNYFGTPITISTEGTYNILARQTDVSGNVSSSSALVTVIIDKTAPSAPTIVGLVSGSYNVNKSFTIGNVETNATVEYSFNNGSAWTTYTSTVTISAEATYNILARQTDVSGNVSSNSTLVTVIIDKTPPSAPTIIGLVSGSYNVNKTFTIGNIETNATVEYSFNNGSAWTTYTSTVTISVDGTYNILARQTDVAGNVSSSSTLVTVIIDKTAPSAPTIIVTLPTFTLGNIESGATPQYKLMGAGGNTGWVNYSTEVALGAWLGDFVVQARQYDSLGNMSTTTIDDRSYGGE